MSERAAVIAALSALAVLAAGCATQRPVLYPNEAVRNAGWDGTQEDIDACVAAAKAYVDGPSAAERTAGATVVGAATGAAVGGAYGGVWGRAGRRAGAGAAGGAAAGLMSGIFRSRRPDPIEARFVGICLSRQGYQVIGWK